MRYEFVEVLNSTISQEPAAAGGFFDRLKSASLRPCRRPSADSATDCGAPARRIATKLVFELDRQETLFVAISRHSTSVPWRTMPGARNVLGIVPSPAKVNFENCLYHFPCGISGLVFN